MPRREAIIQAGRVRLRPILMTTFALIAGMVPVAVGSGEGADFRSPLGVAVIGGVLTSTFLSLLVIPTVYEILSEARDWVGARFSRSTTTVQPHGAPRTSPQPGPRSGAGRHSVPAKTGRHAPFAIQMRVALPVLSAA